MTDPTGSAALERERALPTASKTPSGSASGTRTPPVKAWLQPTVIALIVVAAFLASYIGLQRDPQPHQVPVAVTGPDLAGEIRQGLGDAVDVHPAADAAAARNALERHEVVAALIPTGTDQIRLEVAGAVGTSTTSAVQGLVDAYAQGAGMQVTTKDVVPLTHYDARGLAGFYMAFGVTLAGFVLGSNVLGLAGLMRLRQRFWLMVGASTAIGAVASAIAGPVLGAVPAPSAPLVLTLALLAAAAAFTTKLLGTYLGPIGLPVATLLLLTVGNATSGAVIGADLLPAAARFVSALLPPGAAVRAITDLSYYNGTHIAGPLITLTLWSTVAAVLLGLRPRLMRRAPSA